MLTREQALIEKIESLGIKDVEKEISKQEGSTRMQKIINLLESLNAEESKVDIQGIFTGSFVARSTERTMWRLAAEGNQGIVLDVENAKFRKKEPSFGDSVTITDVNKIYHRISDRTEHNAHSKSKIKIKPGDVLEVTNDIALAEEGWSLMSASLYRHNITGDKGLISDRVNLKITVRGLEPDKAGNDRYANMFINRTEYLVALFPKEDQPYIEKCLEESDYGAVEEALASIEWNPNLRLPGASLIFYGNLENRKWESSSGEERDGWQVGVMQIYNLDNLSLEQAEEKPKKKKEAKKETKKEEPKESEEEIEEEPEKEEEEESSDTEEQEAKKETKKEEPKESNGIDIQDAIDYEIKEAVMAEIKSNPDIQTIALMNAVMTKTECQKTQFVAIVNQMSSEGYLQPAKGKFKILKDLE